VDASDIPKMAEPWFLMFNATVEFQPVMTPEDLVKAGLEELGKSGDKGDRWGIAIGDAICHPEMV
jgi:hypothetical protein